MIFPHPDPESIRPVKCAVDLISWVYPIQGGATEKVAPLFMALLVDFEKTPKHANCDF